MLTSNDAGVVRRDPAIPGLRLLFDNEAFADLLQSCGLSASVDKVQATYTRYKPATSCLVAYHVKAGGIDTEIYAKAYSPGSAGKLHKARMKKGVAGILAQGRAVLDEIGIIVYAFPNDRKLGALVNLSDKKRRQKLLATLLPRQPELWNARVHSLHYKPERRYVGKIMSKAGARAVVKVYVEDEYPGAEYGARAFKSNGILRVARRLGRSRRHSILVFEWLKGKPLGDAVRNPDFSLQRVHDVGAALAEIHMQNSRELPRRTRESEAIGALSAAEACAAVCPNLAQPMRRFALHMAANLLQIPCRVSLIHGDFSADQVVLRNDKIAILDFDSAALGDPAADIGTFAARLERDVIKGEMTPGRKETLMSALLEGYISAKHDGPPPRIGLYTAIGLLQLAPLSFRYREQDWNRLTERIFERAMEAAADD